MMQICAVSDIHGDIRYITQAMPSDICCIIGDLVDNSRSLNLQIAWLIDILFPVILSHQECIFIVVYGNHDHALRHIALNCRKYIPDNMHILDNSCITVNGIVFYGIPFVDSDAIINFVPPYCNIFLTHQPPLCASYLTGSKHITSFIEEIEPDTIFCGHEHFENHDQQIYRKCKIYNVAQTIRRITYE